MNEISGDIRFVNYSKLGYADIGLADSGRDVEGDGGLETAVLISLFTNARENDESRLPGNINDKGGWWGSEFSEFEIGSRLWLLRRARNRNEILSLSEQYARQALQWMIDREVAETVEVESSFSDQKTLQLDIQISRPKVTETDRYTYRYFYNWENQTLWRE